MTPVFCCGGECGGAHWTATGSGVTYDTGTVRSGARSIKVSPAAANTGITFTLGTASAFVVLRMYVNITVDPGADTRLFGVRAGAGTIQGPVFKSSTGLVYIQSTASVGVSLSGGWHRVEIAWDGTPGNYSWYVDGVLIETVVAGGASTWDTFQIGAATGSPTYTAFYDDIVLSNTLADHPIGGGYVNHFVPTADGTHNIAGTGDFQRGNSGTDILNATTTSWQLIDDVPLPSGAVDEADNQRAVAPVNATDYPEVVFGPAPGISTPTFAPRAVEVILAHHQIATGAGSFDVQLNDNGTTDAVVSVVGAAGVVTYRYARKHYATPPTGGAWKVTSGAGNFNNLRSRFRCGDANPDACLDGIMIEAEFDYVGSPKRKFINQSVNRASTY